MTWFERENTNVRDSNTMETMVEGAIDAVADRPDLDHNPDHGQQDLNPYVTPERFVP